MDNHDAQIAISKQKPSHENKLGLNKIAGCWVAYLGPSRASTMEIFCEIVNEPLTTFAKKASS